MIDKTDKKVKKGKNTTNKKTNKINIFKLRDMICLGTSSISI